MGRGDGAAIAGSKEHGNAISNEDGTDAAGRTRDGSVGTFVRSAGRFRGPRIEVHHPHAMHLLQPRRLTRQAQVGTHATPVFSHGGRIINDMRPKVQGIEWGRAHSAGA